LFDDRLQCIVLLIAPSKRPWKPVLAVTLD
jgi:hypothetical protein